MLSTFAIETYVEHYDLAAAMENNGCYTIASIIHIPNADAYTTELNELLWQSSIVNNLANMYLTLGDMEYNGLPVAFNGDPYGNPDELMDALTIQNWMEILNNMEIGDVLTPEDLIRDPELVQRSLEIQQTYLGCDELVSLAISITLDGKPYYLCVDVACYDGRWYNCKPFGTIATLLGADIMSGGLYSLED